MDTLAKAASICLAQLRVMPATVLFAPSLAERISGLAPGGEAGVLTVHRGVLLLAITVAALCAAFDLAARLPLDFVAWHAWIVRPAAAWGSGAAQMSATGRTMNAPARRR